MNFHATSLAVSSNLPTQTEISFFCNARTHTTTQSYILDSEHILFRANAPLHMREDTKHDVRLANEATKALPKEWGSFSFPLLGCWEAKRKEYGGYLLSVDTQFELLAISVEDGKLSAMQLTLTSPSPFPSERLGAAGARLLEVFEHIPGPTTVLVVVDSRGWRPLDLACFDGIETQSMLGADRQKLLNVFFPEHGRMLAELAQSWSQSTEKLLTHAYEADKRLLAFYMSTEGGKRGHLEIHVLDSSWRLSFRVLSKIEHSRSLHLGLLSEPSAYGEFPDEVHCGSIDVPDVKLFEGIPLDGLVCVQVPSTVVLQENPLPLTKGRVESILERGMASSVSQLID